MQTTPVPGLLVVHLDVREDPRGWFKENWQREKMVAHGVPDFGPVQNNISFNGRAGTTRGIHAEPWDKFVSVGSGRAFGAWVDLRAGDSFGAVFTVELTPWVAVFVPRGVGNSFQTLEDATSYTYLVNEHWRPDASYAALALDDPTVAIPWPIPLAQSEVSAKDLHDNPRLAEVVPMPPRRTLVLGADGQLGRALREVFPDAHAVGRSELDLSDLDEIRSWPWSEYDTIINAAAWTAVDAAEDQRGPVWSVNASAPAELASVARDFRMTLVHYSTDYVFDGTRPLHAEDEPLSPLGIYGQSKAAAELAIAGAPRHFILRTSWLVGDGANFVRTMAALADRGVSPQVVDDQFGRLTFADELARATKHLLDTSSPFGTYHVSNSGEPTSWCEVAREVFRLRGRDPQDVSEVSTVEYFRDRPGAPRPRHSTFALEKLADTGFRPADALPALAAYVAELPRG
ncbi:sugar nucleotide-binding protein [Nocardioides guangzhouensis]|uniref:sugar nucleotide-binding protein n=1 Tax=Nocardioides guangzhouensis TaxID=2497878 RepID=UPI003CCC6657